LNEFQFQLEPTRVRTPSRRLVVDRFSARFYHQIFFFVFLVFFSRFARDDGTIADWHRVRAFYKRLKKGRFSCQKNRKEDEDEDEDEDEEEARRRSQTSEDDDASLEEKSKAWC
jgi:hypothetical protein